MKTTRNEVDMSKPEMNCRILKILADNAINNISPHVMDSDTIAEILNINLARTKQLLNALHASGLIITNMDSQYSLITQDGIRWLGSMSTAPQDIEYSRKMNAEREDGFQWQSVGDNHP